MMVATMTQSTSALGSKSSVGRFTTCPQGAAASPSATSREQRSIALVDVGVVVVLALEQGQGQTEICHRGTNTVSP
jgi:hypothetical protein